MQYSELYKREIVRSLNEKILDQSNSKIINSATKEIIKEFNLEVSERTVNRWVVKYSIGIKKTINTIRKVQEEDILARARNNIEEVSQIKDDLFNQIKEKIENKKYDNKEANAINSLINALDNISGVTEFNEIIERKEKLEEQKHKNKHKKAIDSIELKKQKLELASKNIDYENKKQLDLFYKDMRG